jgi:hypothetical protein
MTKGKVSVEEEPGEERAAVHPSQAQILLISCIATFDGMQNATL